MTKEKKEDITIFDYQADQPDRVYDKEYLMRYYKYALLYIQQKGLSLTAEFLNIVQIRFTTEGKYVPTAGLAYSKGRRELWLNVNFLLDVVFDEKQQQEVFKTVETEYDIQMREKYDVDFKIVKRFAFLITHELMHSIFGHVSQKYYNKKNYNLSLMNVVTDIYINNFLGKIYNYDVSLTNSYISKKELTEDYLNFAKWCSPNYTPLQTKSPEGLDEVKIFNSLQNIMDVDIIKLYHLLKSFLPKQYVNSAMLLGSHSDSEDEEKQKSNANQQSEDSGEKENKDEDEGDESKGSGLEKLEDIPPEMAKILKEMGKKAGTGFKGMFDEKIFIEKEQNKEFLKALAASKVLQEMQGNIKSYIKKYKDGNKQYLSTRPDPKKMTRTEKIFVVKKEHLPFYNRTQGVEKYKAVVYLDVSGSLFHLVPKLYGLLSYASQIFDLDIKIFSTELYDISLKEIKSGDVKTTYGTDFDTWGQDLADNDKYKVALIITDGYGDMKKEILSKIIKDNKQKINYILVKGNLPEYLQETANRIWDLDIDV